jgi:uncharacterized membrane protein YheB (UPF0754 family)
MTRVHRGNSAVVMNETSLNIALDLVLKNHVPHTKIEHQVNVVLMENALSIVLDKFVPLMRNADQENLVVIVVEVSSRVDVPDLVLANRVKRLNIAQLVNFVAALFTKNV